MYTPENHTRTHTHRAKQRRFCSMNNLSAFCALHPELNFVWYRGIKINGGKCYLRKFSSQQFEVNIPQSETLCSTMVQNLRCWFPISQFTLYFPCLVILGTFLSFQDCSCTSSFLYALQIGRGGTLLVDHPDSFVIWSNHNFMQLISPLTLFPPVFLIVFMLICMFPLCFSNSMHSGSREKLLTKILNPQLCEYLMWNKIAKSGRKMKVYSSKQNFLEVLTRFRVS